MSYSIVTNELKRILNGTSIPEDVAFTIQHYILLIGRKIVASQELINACKRIYQQHRTAIDLVTQHGQVSNLAQAFENFAESKELRVLTVRSNTIFFAFNSWLEIEKYPAADEKRWHSSFPILLWFEVKEKKLLLRLEVGPLIDSSSRPILVSKLQSLISPKNLQKKAITYTFTKITTFIQTIPEYSKSEDLVKGMEDAWRDMLAKEIEGGVKTAIANLADESVQ